jgi:hypothetical protein
MADTRSVTSSIDWRFGPFENTTLMEPFVDGRSLVELVAAFGQGSGSNLLAAMPVWF